MKKSAFTIVMLPYWAGSISGQNLMIGHERMMPEILELNSYSGEVSSVSLCPRISLPLYENISGLEIPEGLYNGNDSLNPSCDEAGPRFPAGIADQLTVELRAAATGVLVYSVSNANLETYEKMTENILHLQRRIEELEKSRK